MATLLPSNTKASSRRHSTETVNSRGNRLWIIGPGAIGRLLAARIASARADELASQGKSSLPDILLIGRRALSTQEISIEMIAPSGDIVIQKIMYEKIDSMKNPPREIPLAIWITTKAHGVEDVWATLQQHISPSTPITCWQNGLSAQPWFAEHHSGLLCASTTEGAWLPESLSTQVFPIQHAAHGQTWLGPWAATGMTSAASTANAHQQVDWLTRAGFSSKAADNMQERLWHKLAVNAAINPLVARFRIRNGQLRDRPFSLMVRQAVSEISAVLNAKQVSAPPQGWQALIDDVIRTTANNRASMLQDVLADRPTEIVAILGPLRSTAAQHGLQIPLLDQLYRDLS